MDEVYDAVILLRIRVWQKSILGQVIFEKHGLVNIDLGLLTMARTMDHRHRSMDYEAWTMVHGSWSMEHGPWTMDHEGPWTIKDHGPLRTMDHGPWSGVVVAVFVAVGAIVIADNVLCQVA